MIDFGNFSFMRQEISLMIIFIVLLVYDIFASNRFKQWYRLAACLLFALHTLSGFLPMNTGTAFGGMFICSGMTILMKNILNIGTLFVLMQSGQWLKTPDTVHKQGEFYVIALATLFGAYLTVSAGNFMLLYIGIESMSLPLACLAAYNKYREKSAEAGAKYILISAFSSGIMLFGLSYLYGATGTMYFAGLKEAVTSSAMTLLGFVFFFTGFAFKISLVPFHLWTADVYEGAPTGVTAFLSVISKGAACFALMFVLWHVFGTVEIVWHHILWGLTVITIVTGNIFAIRQKDIKRFFAFSSISQAGYIMMGIMSGTAQGMTATVYYVLVYLLSNMAAFGVITAVENESGKTGIASFNGLYGSNPKLAFVMMLALFSLAGIPPFAGFFSKYFIFAAAAARGEYLLVFIALINTVVSLYYYLMIVKAMFINQAGEQSVQLIRTDRYVKTSLILCTAGTLAVGIISSIYNYVAAASTGM